MRRNDVLNVHHLLIFDFLNTKTILFQLWHVNQTVFFRLLLCILNYLRNEIPIKLYLTSPFELVAFLIENQINQMSIDETSPFHFLFGLNLDSIFLILQKLSCDCISCPKVIAFFRTKLIDLLRNQFPKTLIVKLMLVGLLEIKIGSWKWGGNQTFVLCVFKVNDIMRFYFTFLLKIIISVV